MKNVKIISELRRIQEGNDGLLLPAHVVAAARPKTSPLHSRFEWNDGKAAQEHRLWQARQLISVCVEVFSNGESAPIFVSVSSDRQPGNGYRATVSVLTDEELCAQLLTDALHDLNTFQKKYARLKQLAGLFSEIKKVRKKAA